MTNQPQDKMRADFEATMRAEPHCWMNRDFHKSKTDGQTYADFCVEVAWKTWQAACAQQSAQASQDALDAARFRQTIRHVGGQRNASCQTFGLVTLKPVSGNIMQGSVAEHFAKAIDSAIKDEKNGC